MIANCPQCAMSLTFDDTRLPTEPFNVLCPRCRQSVTIMPPPKEEPKLPGITGPLDPIPMVDADQPDSLRALVDLLLAGLKQSQPQASDAKKWQRRRVLLCLDDPIMRESLRWHLNRRAMRCSQPITHRKPLRFFTSRAQKSSSLAQLLTPIIRAAPQ